MDKKMLENLYKQTKDMNAGCSHFAIEGVFGDKTATAVLSVYDGQKPAHQVLDELYNWAEETGNREVMNKIETLESELTYLK